MTSQTKLAATLRRMRVGAAIEMSNPNSERDDRGMMRVERRAVGYYGDNGTFDWKAPDPEQAAAKLARWGYTAGPSWMGWA